MNGSTPFYPSQFETFSTTVKLMLEILEPIHGSGRVVTHDSNFCVMAGILALHDAGVFGQALIKKRGRYWLDGVSGDQIDDHFAEMLICETDTLQQTINGKNFLIHCTKDDGYVTKIMSTNGTLREVRSHNTRRVINGEVTNFTYTEPVSQQNVAKHFVNDVNNR